MSEPKPIDVEDLLVAPSACLKPCVPMYAPMNLRDLKPGETKRWCTCGLSAKQPWCDNSHIGTGFKPLIWKVPERAQTLYSICNCKYTADPPYCDATHTSLPVPYTRGIKACSEDHDSVAKLCVKCGFRPPSRAPAKDDVESGSKIDTTDESSIA
ncbi:hypothetical protein BDZ88DRAFT_450903 [Geranomyces variabilis]|nr:hypothetical protein BDZ88DRAFT_450903 [Geranomyces variabilis]KAJ3137129.1 hypothetical protein HDU90_002301 [Geranomyces variabilis]